MYSTQRDRGVRVGSGEWEVRTTQNSRAPIRFTPTQLNWTVRKIAVLDYTTDIHLHICPTLKYVFSSLKIWKPWFFRGEKIERKRNKKIMVVLSCSCLWSVGLAPCGLISISNWPQFLCDAFLILICNCQIQGGRIEVTLEYFSMQQQCVHLPPDYKMQMIHLTIQSWNCWNLSCSHITVQQENSLSIMCWIIYHIYKTHSSLSLSLSLSLSFNQS